MIQSHGTIAVGGTIVQPPPHSLVTRLWVMGLRLNRFYIDDAISGTSSVNRKGFQDMMEDGAE